MKQYNVGVPFERIAIDVAGLFPRSSSGNRYILVVMDYFSKWPEIYPIPNQEAVTVAEVLFENWICRYGVTREIHSDQGRNFESEVFQGVCGLLGIHKTRTTPLHPQSDGMVERFNRTIENILRTAVNEKLTNWDTCIPPFLLAYRAAIHETTGKTPANVIFGTGLRLPIDLIINRPQQEESLNDYLSHLKHRIKLVHEEVREKLKMESDRMKTRYDLRANSSGFQENEKVWLYNPKRTKGKSPKLQKSWEGPYTIVTRINDVVYRIQRSPQAKMNIVHLDRLTPYQEGHADKGVT
ncbi:protein NYNRIN-like [Anoplophora glabripennis]|uniref:protein NYNRIN-like n=1 Tax=Anoplophora glabripennis TaxID=217634 RepID=UPI000873B55E|nr:protein NYNRIN-like [Anoplophora glabripennis]